MSSILVGSAPDSWGVWFPDDPGQIPCLRFLDEVAAAGYEWIELGPFGYLPTVFEHLHPVVRAKVEAEDLRPRCTPAHRPAHQDVSGFVRRALSALQ